MTFMPARAGMRYQRPFTALVLVPVWAEPRPALINIDQRLPAMFGQYAGHVIDIVFARPDAEHDAVVGQICQPSVARAKAVQLREYAPSARSVARLSEAVAQDPHATTTQCLCGRVHRSWATVPSARHTS